MKKKQFCYYLVCFLFSLCFFEIAQAENRVLKISQDEIAKIKEHNRQQLENRKFILDYQKKHAFGSEVKTDAYWDMAFHARLADYGDKDSQYIIAKAYENGEQTNVNYKKALYFYKKAAEQGHIESAMHLGRIYTENKWLQKDNEKALYYYMKAAEQSYAPAQMKVALIYEEKEEYQKAYDWFLKAMVQIFPYDKDLQKRSRDLERLAEKLKTQAESEESHG